MEFNHVSLVYGNEQIYTNVEIFLIKVTIYIYTHIYI